MYERGANILLRWYENGRGASDTIKASEYPELLTEALLRAAEINRRLDSGRSGRNFKKTTIKQACKAYLANKEVSDTCSSGRTIGSYRTKLDRIIEFSDTTSESRRCKCIHEIDSAWCQAFCAWLDTVRTTRNGGPVTTKNPERPLSDYQKQQIRRLFARTIEHGMLLEPPLVPRDFRSPMAAELIGRRPEDEDDLSDPSVSVNELVAIVAVLDQYALGLLAPLFLFAPRPSELGRVLPADYDVEAAALHVKCRKDTGYQTKGRRNKTWPVTAELAACIQPFMGRGAGPLFPKRRIFEGKVNPGLLDADEERLAQEYDRRCVEKAKELGRPLSKEEREKVSDQVWAAAGAVTSKDVLNEMQRAAERAGLDTKPTSLGVRHLVETLCEEARMANGILRHILGHKPHRGDSLPKYFHARLTALREQVAVLDERRKPLIEAISARASELARRRPE
jgi:integrase